MASSCSHSMCIGGVCAEFGARMEDEKSKKMKVKNVPPRPCSHPMRMGSLCTHCGAKVESGENSNHHSKSLVHAATTSKVRRKLFKNKVIAYIYLSDNPIPCSNQLLYFQPSYWW